MKTYKDETKNISIKAAEITIGKNVSFGKNIDVNIRGKFSLGDRSRLGDDIVIRGNTISFGKDLYHSKGLKIGGGGIYHPNANLAIGDRCTIHNNFINVCEPVIIGNDVGLSPEASILTHGYWLSVLEGFPAKFAGVQIHDGAIIGYRSLIMMGVTIGKNAVVGAGSIVTSDLKENSIYAGNPARFIREIKPLEKKDRILKLDQVIAEYRKIAAYHGIHPTIKVKYPIVTVNGCEFNVETLTFIGKEDRETDDFRDCVRKWGFRFYSDRPFKPVWPE
ncbi:MAG: acyltransferase [Euryarchaeota archaeon]|nr:acyltransferase [Euryarchaeota archaeon]